MWKLSTSHSASIPCRSPLAVSCSWTRFRSPCSERTAPARGYWHAGAVPEHRPARANAHGSPAARGPGAPHGSGCRPSDRSARLVQVRDRESRQVSVRRRTNSFCGHSRAQSVQNHIKRTAEVEDAHFRRSPRRMKRLLFHPKRQKAGWTRNCRLTWSQVSLIVHAPARFSRIRPVP